MDWLQKHLSYIPTKKKCIKYKRYGKLEDGIDSETSSPSRGIFHRDSLLLLFLTAMMPLNPCKIIGTILKLDKRGTQKNGPKDKKIMTVHKALHSRNDTGCKCQQGKERIRLLCEDCVCIHIRTLRLHQKEEKKKLILAVNNSIDNVNIDRKTNTTKQKCK